MEEENKKNLKEKINAFLSVKRNKIITAAAGGVLLVGIVLAIALPIALSPKEDPETAELNKKLGITPVFDDENKTVTYGLYPQTHVKDTATIEALSALTSTETNGWYKLNEEYYAKRTVEQYNESYMYDDGTKIVHGSEDWFKCEPITWKILNNDNGTYSLLSSTLLEVAIFDTDSNNYKDSEIRSWLTGKFFDSAFNLNSSLLETTEVDNSAETTDSEPNDYACDNTFDKVYLLSYKDYMNENYGFEPQGGVSDTRVCKASDYAMADNCYRYQGYSYYWTRSSSWQGPNKGFFVGHDGEIWRGSVNTTGNCVRPAITIKYAR